MSKVRDQLKKMKVPAAEDRIAGVRVRRNRRLSMPERCMCGNFFATSSPTVRSTRRTLLYGSFRNQHRRMLTVKFDRPMHVQRAFVCGAAGLLQEVLGEFEQQLGVLF